MDVAQLLDIGLKEGIFAVMFMWLLIKVMQRTEAREDKLYNFLEEMKDEFAKLGGHYDSLAKDVAEIREDLSSKGE